MTHIRLRCEFDDGRSVEVTPTSFEPLTARQLHVSIEKPDNPIEIAFLGTETVIDGITQQGEGRITTKITFPHSPAPFALVLGGWLPMTFAIPQHFLVDRNVVATLRRIRTSGLRDSDVSFSWWTQIIEGGSAVFNPLLYAYEGRHRRTPSMQEFIGAFTEGVTELRTAFPQATVVEYERIHFESAYAQLMALQVRGARDILFLLETIPFVLNRVPRQRERQVQDKLLQIATKLGVLRVSPVVLAVLSILYEDVHGNFPSIGRRLLKPMATYTTENAYNAISDLRHIEIAALSHSVLPDKAFALCTNDHGIALFWSALEFHGKMTEDSLLQMHYRLGTDLFARLNDYEIQSLVQVLSQ